jgi:hypothetical protein
MPWGRSFDGAVGPGQEGGPVRSGGVATAVLAEGCVGVDQCGFDGWNALAPGPSCSGVYQAREGMEAPRRADQDGLLGQVRHHGHERWRRAQMVMVHPLLLALGYLI